MKVFFKINQGASSTPKVFRRRVLTCAQKQAIKVRLQTAVRAASPFTPQSPSS